MKYVAKEIPEGINAPRTNALGEFAILLLGLVAILGGSFWALGWVADAIALRMSPAVERALGARFSFTFGENTSVGIERERALFERLAAHVTLEGYDLHLDVVCTTDVNALALPGGRVVVLSGLLDAVQSENELAFVLAHELAHFVHRDHLRALGRGLVWLTMLTMAGIGGDAATSMTGTLVQRGFSQQQELAADRLAAELVHGTLGHLGGATDFFERRELRGRGGWFSTHPGSAARIDHLRRLAAERGWKAEAVTPYRAPSGLCTS